MPPAKKTIGLREVRVGLFVIIAAVGLILLILNASGDISFKSKRHFKAKFASADGKRIEELVRTDSEAQLVSPGLLGTDKVIAITAGSAAGGPAPEGFELPTKTEGGMAQLTASGNQLVTQLNRLS